MLKIPVPIMSVDALGWRHAAGIHMLRVSVQIPFDELPLLKQNAAKRIKSRRPRKSKTRPSKELYQEWDNNGIDYRYNRFGFLVVGFVMGRFVENSDSDLVPFASIQDVWARVKTIIEDHVGNNNLFCKYKYFISYIEIGCDFFVDDPYSIVKSLDDRYVQNRYSASRSYGQKSSRSSTKSGKMQLTIYDRGKKSKNSTLRLEFRMNTSDMINRWLTISRGQELFQEISEKKSVVLGYFEKNLPKYGIFQDTSILPFYAARRKAKNEISMKYLNNYKLWKQAKNARYYHERLRKKENFIIGTVKGIEVVRIDNLYEAVNRAVSNAFSAQSR